MTTKKWKVTAQMKDIEHNYNVSVQHSGRVSVIVSAHMIAVLVAEKLGLPVPIRDRDCEVIEMDPQTRDVDSPDDNPTRVSFAYRASVNSGPVTIVIPGKPDKPEREE